MIDARVASGTRDILPALAIQRNWILSQFKNTFEQYGFVPIDTPVLERREVLYAKGGGSEEVQRQVFEVAARGQKLEQSELALRFDLTVPLARFMARHVDEIRVPFKRYHIGLVYRGERAQRGRFREFYQCDFDTIGSSSALSDAEIGLVIHDGLQAVGVPFTLRLNHRKILNGMLDTLSLVDQSGHVLRSLDKWEKIGPDAVLDELQFGKSRGPAPEDSTAGEEDAGTDGIVSNASIKPHTRRVLTLDQARRIMDFVESARGKRPHYVLDDVHQRIGSNSLAREGIDNLRQVCDLLISGGAAEDRIVVDVGMARGLDYYTGVVYESMVAGYENYGSVGSGGRYDDLAKLFTDRQLPGVGASFGLDRLTDLMAEAGWLKTGSTIAPVLLVNFAATDWGQYLAIARELRAAGIGCEVYAESKSLRDQFGYASTRGHRLAVIAGPDELAANECSLRVMATRQQQKLPRVELVARVAAALAGSS